MRRRFYAGDISQTDFRTYTPGTKYGVGAAPARPAPTVTAHAQGLVSMAAQPIRWGVRQAAGLAHFLGNTLSSIGNKL